VTLRLRSNGRAGGDRDAFDSYLALSPHLRSGPVNSPVDATSALALGLGRNGRHTRIDHCASNHRWHRAGGSRTESMKNWPRAVRATIDKLS
jgi:hypothetical protein